MRGTRCALALAGVLGCGVAWAAAGNAGGAGAGAGSANGAAGGAVRNASGNAGNTAVQGVIRGTVRGVNVDQGIVTIQTANRTVTLNGLPTQLSGLNPGDVVAFRYNNYAGAPWIRPSGNGGFSGAYQSAGRVTGPVQQVNRASGLITVRGVTFRAHPALTQNLYPGQFVSVGYVQVGNVDWASNVRPVAAASNGAYGAGNAGYGNNAYGGGARNGAYGNGAYGNGAYGNGAAGNGAYGNGAAGNGAYGNGYGNNAGNSGYGNGAGSSGNAANANGNR